MLETIDTIAALRDALTHLPSSVEIGLVPTMGALHAGHAALVERARAECGTVVVTIFVNPLQFDRHDDLVRYPRSLDTDVSFCRARGVDIVFAPSSREMYPQPQVCTVDVGELAERLCGTFRPGHFRGVATVVLKLFEIVRPDRAYFGEKDAQQLAIVRRLVADFAVPITIVGVPTVRESDGLALSSRNAHLAPEDRARATSLYRALLEARARILAGDRDAERVKAASAMQIPAAADMRLEYLEIVAPADLQAVKTIERPVLVAGALWVGTTRLIDNVLVE